MLFPRPLLHAGMDVRDRLQHRYLPEHIRIALLSKTWEIYGGESVDFDRDAHLQE